MISGMLFFVCRKSETEIVKKIKAKMMSTKQEEFWKQYSKENNCVLFKGDWDQFCKAKNINEESLKKLLFKGELSENEFQSVVFCIIITVPFESPSLFYPVLFKKCPQLIERCNWDMLNNLDWLILLEKYPQFADKFDKWDEFDGEDWSCLLCEQPQFADKCDKWDEIDSEDWVELLCSQPQFADKCNKWEELDEQDWANLLSEKPQFADKCNWDSLKGIGWCRLLATQPQFADKCDWDKLDGSAWRYLLSERPQFADKCDVWDYLDAAQWRSLLKNQPQLVDKCAKSSIVVNVLIKHPQFTEHCNTSIITEKGKAKLLAKHPDLVKYFPKKTETKVPKKKQIKNKLVALLLENENAEVLKQPQFADECNKWDEFNENEKEELIDAHLNLAKYFK